MYANEVKDPDLKLEASNFESITFTEINSYNPSFFARDVNPSTESLTFFPHNTRVAAERGRAYSSSVVLTWRRYVRYIGKPRHDLLFPGRVLNDEFLVTCFVSTDPIRVSAIGVKVLND